MKPNSLNSSYPSQITHFHAVAYSYSAQAATITPRDVMNCHGLGLRKEMLPYVPGYDLVGTIQSLGEKSRADGVFRRGDRVAGVTVAGGCNSRFISVPANRLYKISSRIKSTHVGKLIQTYRC